MSEIIKTEIDLYTDTCDIEGVPATFDVEWTNFGGTYSHKRWEARAELISVTIGGLELNRDQVIKMTSTAYVDGLEEAQIEEQEAA